MSVKVGLTVAGESSPIEKLAVNTIRTLCMDAVQAANSGHPGSPMDMAPTEAFIAFNGLLRALVRRKIVGASLCVAREYNMRPVAKMPLFSEETIAAMTTRLTMLAAAGKPARSNTMTNGLWFGSRERQSATTMIAASDPT